jgi:hypothetical protein
VHEAVLQKVGGRRPDETEFAMLPLHWGDVKWAFLGGPASGQIAKSRKFIFAEDR